MGEARQHIHTVSELTILLRSRLEQAFPDLWVEGEVSNLRTPSSGHIYFTLKDQTSQIRVVLFRSSAQRLRFDLQEGLHLVVRGRVTVYEARGEYQLVLEYLEPKGIGALQIRFEQLKERLAGEGLFDQDRKRPLPLLPRRVAIVTSLSGAAVRDMVAIISRRCPILAILIYPVPVQGDDAAPEIAAAIRAIGGMPDVEVLIVGRGGGSWEDLWCFNEEVVVRAIAECPIPVVSAVGHEIDFTLADFAADHRAATPSEAAEAVAPVLDDLIRTAVDWRVRQERAMRARLALLRQRVIGLQERIPMVRVRVLRHAQHLDDVLEGLAGAVRMMLSDLRERVLADQHALGLSSPLTRVRSAGVLVRQLVKRIEQSTWSMIALKRGMVGSRVAALDGLSPLAILGRGYSITRRETDGAILKDAEDASVDDEVRTRLAAGELICQVRKILPGR